MDPHLPFLITRSPIAIHIYINDNKKHGQIGFPSKRELRREVIVRFVAICRIVDHHCLNFLFMTIHTLQQLEINVNENKTIDNTIAGSITLIVN
jgi:hypothetical protein